MLVVTRNLQVTGHPTSSKTMDIMPLNVCINYILTSEQDRGEVQEEYEGEGS